MGSPAARRRAPANVPTNDSRKKLIIAVHTSARRLGLDEDARRDVQVAATGKRSLTEMSIAEMGKVLDQLNRDRKPSGRGAHVGKIRALWWSLYWLGEVASPEDDAISAFVRRQTGIATLRFLDHRHAPPVIEALKDWLTRVGVQWPKDTQGLGDRRAVCWTIWNRLRDVAQLGDATLGDYVGQVLRIAPTDMSWSAQEWDAAIRLLGRKLQRAQAA